MKTRAKTRTSSRRRMSSRSLNGRGGRPSSSRRSTSLRRASTRRRATTARSSGRTGHSAELITDHEEIKQWVEQRGGHPATVESTAKGDEQAGVLRIDFPGFTGEGTLKAISWDEWFNIFDERRLGLLVQKKTAGGKQSRFNKLVCRT